MKTPSKNTGVLAPVVGPMMASVMHYCVHSAFLVSLVTSFPLQMWPARLSLWQLVARDRPFVGAGYYATTYGLLATAALLAVVCPSVWVALQWIGMTIVCDSRLFTAVNRCYCGDAHCVCDSWRAHGAGCTERLATTVYGHSAHSVWCVWGGPARHACHLL